MDLKQLAGYVASGVAVLGGFAFLYVPPATLAHDAIVGLGFSLITGGFAGFGVTVAVPRAVAQARMLGQREAMRPPR
jgi:hypothetical protein